MHTFDINNPIYKHNPFKIPNGYFEQMTKNVMAQIHNSSVITQNTEPHILRWIPWIGVACVVSLFILFSNVKEDDSHSINSLLTTTSTKIEQAQEDEMLDYLIMANADIINTYEEY